MIQTILELLASATFIWTASIVVVILMAVALEYEREGLTSIFFSLAIALLLWNYYPSVLGFLLDQPLSILGFSIGYIVVGVIWSFIKWRSYIKNIFDEIAEIKAKFLVEHTTITDKNIRFLLERIVEGYFIDYTKSYLSYYSRNDKDTFEMVINKITPAAADKKATIVAWISYWPMSLLGTLLNDPFRKLFNSIYKKLSGSYDKMTNSYKHDLLK